MAAECDFSWLDASDRLLNARQHYAKEPMTSILVHTIYVNSTNTVVKVASERMALRKFVGGDANSGISEGCLLAAVQARKTAAPDSLYKLSDILLYNMNISPENIQHYAALDSEDDSFLKAIPLCANGISIPDSVFIFHDINCLYMIYSSYPASILKSDKTSRQKHKTRRVMFKPLPSRKTRYARPELLALPTAESVDAITDALEDTMVDISSGDERLSPEDNTGDTNNTLSNISRKRRSDSEDALQVIRSEAVDNSM
jgi:hypothetical protein